MGVLPLEFKENESWKSLSMEGTETVSIKNIGQLSPRGNLDVEIKYPDGSEKVITTTVRIDTENEHEYYKNGGILHYVLRNLANESI
jgi:aconitate hydratase